jgi:hypothetical protein
MREEATKAFACSEWLTPALFCDNDEVPSRVFGVDLSAVNDSEVGNKIVQMQEKYRHVVQACIAEIVDTKGLLTELDSRPSPWPNCWPRFGPEDEIRRAMLDKCPSHQAAVLLCYSKDGNESWEAPVLEIDGKSTLGEWVKREGTLLPGESLREYFKLLKDCVRPPDGPQEAGKVN